MRRKVVGQTFSVSDPLSAALPVRCESFPRRRWTSAAFFGVGSVREVAERF